MGYDMIWYDMVYSYCDMIWYDIITYDILHIYTNIMLYNDQSSFHRPLFLSVCIRVSTSCISTKKRWISVFPRALFCQRPVVGMGGCFRLVKLVKDLSRRFSSEDRSCCLNHDGWMWWFTWSSKTQKCQDLDENILLFMGDVSKN